MRAHIVTLVSAAALALSGLTTSAFADFKAELMKPDTLVIGTTGSAPPTTMVDTAGNLAGYEIDLMTKVAEELGVKIEWVQLDWAGLLPGLAAGRFDIVASGVTRTPERVASADFILLSPSYITGTGVTKLATNDKINSWADICSGTMGEIRGATWGKFAREQGECAEGAVQVREYPGWTEMVLDLKAGRVDWIANGASGSFYSSRLDPELFTLEEVRGVLTQGVAVAPGKTELAAAVDAIIKKYREDGTLSEIAQSGYGVPLDWSTVEIE